MSSQSRSNRRPSFPSSSSQAILRNADKPVKPFAANLVKHGKYVVIGAAGCWFTEIQDVIMSIWEGQGGWIKMILVGAVACHAFTVSVFLYLVLFLPYFRGYIPNYPKWQESARLRLIVPLLTLSILFGWTGYVVALSQAGKRSALGALGDAVKGVGQADLSKLSGGQGLSLFSSIMGTTALYTLTLGLLGFIQAPAGTPVRKKEKK